MISPRALNESLDGVLLLSTPVKPMNALRQKFSQAQTTCHLVYSFILCNNDKLHKQRCWLYPVQDVKYYS